ncbi:MAG: hypothetical protein AABX83_00620 [Nanoarchaeota archaeon]
MGLACEIADYYSREGIKINYDPFSSTCKTWFGACISVKFDLESRAMGGVYYKDKKEISMPYSGKIDKIAKNLLHEMGHANTSTGSNILTDATMIPAVLLATKFIEKTIYDGTDLVSAGMLFVTTTLMSRYIISELFAECYKYGKLIFRRKK